MKIESVRLMEATVYDISFFVFFLLNILLHKEFDGAHMWYNDGQS